MPIPSRGLLSLHLPFLGRGMAARRGPMEPQDLQPPPSLLGQVAGSQICPPSLSSTTMSECGGREASLHSPRFDHELGGWGGGVT